MSRRRRDPGHSANPRILREIQDPGDEGTPETGDEEPDYSSPLTIGLSPDDRQALEDERRALFDQLMTTAAGRDLVRRSDEQVSRSGSGVADDIRALIRTARSGSGPAKTNDSKTVKAPNLASQSAAVVLDELGALCQEEANRETANHRSPLYQWAQRAHRWIDTRIRFGRNATSLAQQRLIARHWGIWANLFTVAATVSLFWGSNYAVAGSLVLARILITTVVWAMAAFPDDASPHHPVLDSDPRVCTVGHAGDMLLFLGFAATLATAGQLDAAFMVVLSAWITIFGTLMRISASARGFLVPRLHLERLVRGGSTLAGLALAAFGGGLSHWWAPAIMVALPTIFAAIEGQESWRALSSRPAIAKVDVDRSAQSPSQIALV